MDPIQQIKARLPIADVVGSYVRLERAGSNFRALCPFHKEKSPSFNVSPARDAYYCFGCAKGGDIFTFVQEIEGLSFPEVLKVLADRAGVQLPERHQRLDQEKSAKERLVELMEATAKIFIANLSRHQEVREYLHARGLTDETIEKFRIGFAPLAWRELYDGLRAKGFSDSEMERARVVKKVEGKGYYDTFRGRVMFPIADPSGRVIAFTGRVFGDQKAPDGTPVAKYLNSPEGELYDKSRTLFAYDRAKVPMRKADRAVLVEGQMDCIMTHQAGSENTIAISGTALTSPQIDLIKRLTNNITLALDADNAGVQATLRSAKIALAKEMKVLVAMIPDGKDPADFVAAHPGEWANVLADATPVIPYLLRIYAKQNLHGDSLREKIQTEVFPLVLAMPSHIAQAQVVAEIARLLGVRDDVVFEDLRRTESKLANEQKYDDAPIGETTAPVPRTQRSPRELANDELHGLLLWQAAHAEAQFDPSPIRDRHRELYRSLGLDFPSYEDADESRLLIFAESQFGPEARLLEIAEELLDRIERELLRERQSALLREIARAESAKEDARPHIDAYRTIAARVRALEDRVTQQTFTRKSS